jgi:hypothetical protein
VVFLDEPGGDYWRSFQKFVDEHLLARALISEEDLSLYKMTDSAEEAVREILDFFRVYHSMRWVHDRLVLRLHAPPDAERLERIQQDFRDILVGGPFVVGGPLPEERDEPALADLPRLIFPFNRRNYGRLRQLIDCLNAKKE